MPFLPGQEVRAWVIFKNDAGVDADPTTVTLNVRKPDGTLTSYTYEAAEIDRTALGHFEKRFIATQSGTWMGEFRGTGAVQTTAQFGFVVDPAV